MKQMKSLANKLKKSHSQENLTSKLYLYLCYNTILQKCVRVNSRVFPIAESHCQPNGKKLQHSTYASGLC